MVSVSLHYWAGAKAAAGMAEERVEAETVAEALQIARSRRADGRFDRVIRASTVLVDGATAHPADLERPLTGPTEVEILPPFAGGAPKFCPHMTDHCGQSHELQVNISRPAVRNADTGLAN